MKLIKTFFFLVFMMLIVSCSGGGGGGGNSSSGGGTSLICDNNGVPKFSMTSDSTAKVGQPFTENYSWCDSDGDITELWWKVTLNGKSLQDKFNAADYRIAGTSGTQQNKYNWPSMATGDYVMDLWVKDAKGQVSNTASIKITVTAKEVGQSKVFPSFGGGIIEKVLKKVN